MGVEYLGPLDQRQNYDDEVAEAAQKYGVDPELAIAVHRQEYNPNQWISSAGARGPMQLMPDTAKGMGVKNIDDPYQNIDGGVRYLKQMLDERKGNVPLALASYNAGPAKVGDGVPVFTYGYVKKVMERANDLRAHPKIEYLGPGDGQSDSQPEPQVSALPDHNRGMGTPAPSDPNKPRENDIDIYGDRPVPNPITPVNANVPFTRHILTGTLHLLKGCTVRLYPIRWSRQYPYRVASFRFRNRLSPLLLCEMQIFLDHMEVRRISTGHCLMKIIRGQLRRQDSIKG